MTTADVTRLFEDAHSLRGLARSLVAHASADDLVQDTLIAATVAPPEGGASRPWLRGVMKNLARMRHREAARRRDREQAVDLAREVEAPDQQLHRVRIQRALCDAVLDLPELYRQVIVLHHFDGLSLAAIARRDGVAEGTIRWRHKEALDRLRAALDERSGGDRRAWLAALAPLDRLPAPAVAAMAKLIAIVLAAIVLATVAVIVIVRSSSPPPPQSTVHAGPVPGAGSGSGRAISAPAAPHLGSAAAPAPDRHVGVFGRVPAAPPKLYLLTVVNPTLAAVDLTGGTSGLYQPDFGPKAAPGSRVITGKVVDASGHTLGGAVVVVGTRLGIQWGQLSGEAGATAAADGSFRIEHAPDGKDAAIIALHPSGWSPVTAARDDVRLVIAPGGAITGKVSYGGTPIAATLNISPAGFEHVRFMFETGDDGRYGFPMLAAGRYEVSAWPTRGIGGGLGNAERAQLTVASSATTTHDFALAEGVLLVVHPAPPVGKVPSVVDVFLLAGHHAIADRAALSALRSQLPRDLGDELLHGGSNAADPIQFHDRAPGPYTACAELRFDDTDARAFGCQTFDLAASPNVRELEVATK